MFCVTGANRHDSVVFEPLVDALPDGQQPRIIDAMAQACLAPLAEPPGKT